MLESAPSLTGQEFNVITGSTTACGRGAKLTRKLKQILKEFLFLDVVDLRRDFVQSLGLSEVKRE